MISYNIPKDCDDFVPQNGDLVTFNNGTIAIYNNSGIFFGVKNNRVNNRIVYNGEFLSVPTEEQVYFFEIMVAQYNYIQFERILL